MKGNRAPLAGEDIRRGVKEAFQTLSPSMFQRGTFNVWVQGGQFMRAELADEYRGALTIRTKAIFDLADAVRGNLRGKPVPETVFTQLKDAASDASDLLEYFIGGKHLPADLQLAVSSLLTAIRELAAALAIHAVGGPSSSSDR
jgi:hypothetical protein